MNLIVAQTKHAFAAAMIASVRLASWEPHDLMDGVENYFGSDARAFCETCLYDNCALVLHEVRTHFKDKYAGMADDIPSRIWPGNVHSTGNPACAITRAHNDKLKAIFQSGQ